MMEETKGRFTSWTMEDGMFPWFDFVVRCLEKPIYNAFGPLTLGLNQMWTKKDGRAPKSECVDFLDVCPKKVVLRKKTKGS